MLKMQHALAAGYTEVKLGLNWKFLPCWLRCITLAGALKAAEGEMTTAVFLSCGPETHTTDLAGKMRTLVQWCYVCHGVTSCFLIGFEACSVGKSCLLS